MNAGLKVAVATSSSQKEAEIKLSHARLLGFFDTIVTADRVTRGKPHPDIFLAAAELLGVYPKKCVVFEDAANGVEAAKHAGMKVIAVPNKYTQTADFSHADLVVKSLKEVDFIILSRL